MSALVPEPLRSSPTGSSFVCGSFSLCHCRGFTVCRCGVALQTKSVLALLMATCVSGNSPPDCPTTPQTDLQQVQQEQTHFCPRPPAYYNGTLPAPFSPGI